MRQLLALALALSTSVPAMAADYDVEWFYRNPSERRGHIVACRNDVRLDQRICRNAELAEARAWEERVSRGAPPPPSSPITRDAIDIACQQPPARRGLLGVYCPGGRRT